MSQTIPEVFLMHLVSIRSCYIQIIFLVMPQAIAFLPAAPSIYSMSSSSISIEITNAFISASLKPLRVVRGQLALNISIYHSTCFSTGVIAKISLPKSERKLTWGQDMTTILLPLPSKCFTCPLSRKPLLAEH